MHQTARCPIPPLQCFSTNQRENFCKLNYLSAAVSEVVGFYKAPLPSSFSACLYVDPLCADLARWVKHPPRNCVHDKPRSGSLKSDAAFHLQSLDALLAFSILKFCSDCEIQRAHACGMEMEAGLPVISRGSTGRLDFRFFTFLFHLDFQMLFTS